MIAKPDETKEPFAAQVRYKEELHRLDKYLHKNNNHNRTMIYELEAAVEAARLKLVEIHGSYDVVHILDEEVKKEIAAAKRRKR